MNKDKILCFLSSDLEQIAEKVIRTFHFWVKPPNIKLCKKKQPPFVVFEPYNVHPFHAKCCRGENLMWWDIFIGFSKLCFTKVDIFAQNSIFFNPSPIAHFFYVSCILAHICWKQSLIVGAPNIQVLSQNICRPPSGSSVKRRQIFSILLIGFELSIDLFTSCDSNLQ